MFAVSLSIDMYEKKTGNRKKSLKVKEFSLKIFAGFSSERTLQIRAVGEAHQSPRRHRHDGGRLRNVDAMASRAY